MIAVELESYFELQIFVIYSTTRGCVRLYFSLCFLKQHELKYVLTCEGMWGAGVLETRRRGSLSLSLSLSLRRLVIV